MPALVKAQTRTDHDRKPAGQERQAEAGHERAEAARFLAGGAALDEVLTEDRSARRLGISGVPCFIVDGGYAISGAQEPEFFFPLFDLAQNAAVQPVE